jgi:exosortase F-associated protein
MKKRNVYIVFLIFALVGVRVVGAHIFYDPLIPFFHNSEYQLMAIPEIDEWKFAFSLLIRFLLNTGLTLLLVKVIFDKPELIKLTGVILGMVFLVLTPMFLWLVFNAEPEQYRYLFYIRRILIHPVLTLILIPAFLYHERASKKTNND